MAGADKLWLDLQGQPLLARTITAIAATPGLNQLVVVASHQTLERVEPYHQHHPWSLANQWILGGPTRQDSVYCGLTALPHCDLVLIHDGARPLTSLALLQRGIDAAQQHGAAIAAVPTTDTIKVVDGQEQIVATPDRANLRAAQTPQVFAASLIRAAYATVGVARALCTDDAAILELAGIPVFTYPGERTNIKVSTPADVAIVRALWLALQEGNTL